MLNPNNDRKNSKQRNLKSYNHTIQEVNVPLNSKGAQAQSDKRWKVVGLAGVGSRGLSLCRIIGITSILDARVDPESRPLLK